VNRAPLILKMPLIGWGAACGSPLDFEPSPAHADDVDVLTTFLGVLACLATLAAFLLERGWRGWPKNRRPLCRRCNYLLEGLDRPSVCPECGADLRRRRGIRIGELRRRKRMLTAGVLVLLVGIAWVWLFLNTVGRRVNWVSIAPEWALRMQARGTSANATTGGNNAALRELVKRVERREIDGSSLRDLADEALHVQSQPQGVWQPEWGALIDMAWGRNLLTAEQVTQYLRNGYLGAPYIAAAPRVRAGTPLKVVVSAVPARLSPGGPQPWTVVVRMRVRFEDGTTRDFGEHVVANAAVLMLPLDLPLGGHSAVMECETEVRPSIPGAVSLATWATTTPLNLEVIGPADPIVVPVADESLRAAITQAINIHVMPPTTHRHASVEVAFTRPPKALAFDISCRHNGVEKLIGQAAVLPNTLTRPPYTVDLQSLFPDAKTVDFVFRTNAAIAERWTTVREVWDGEITIPNVALPMAEAPSLPMPDPRLP